jgi:hypothetical protein
MAPSPTIQLIHQSPLSNKNCITKYLLSASNLTKFQKGVYYSAIKIFNNLPHNIKDLANEIVLFQNALKRFLLINSFNNSKEYFNYHGYSTEN